MATHEQTYLGPVFEAMEDDDLIVISDDHNSYSIANEFAGRARGAGVVIHADEACPMCQKLNTDAEAAERAIIDAAIAFYHNSDAVAALDEAVAHYLEPHG